MNRRTKIVATLGPASEDDDVVTSMLEAGVDVVRLNLSHGNLEDHVSRLVQVRRIAERLGRQVAVIADLPGPKIRSGQFPAGGIALTTGHVLALVPGDHDCSGDVVSVDYPSLVDDIDVDDRIVIGDGAIVLRAIAVDDAGVQAVVETGGHVQGRPGVHLPSDASRLSAPTDDDLLYAARMVAAGVDFLALSFVRDESDVEKLRSALAPADVSIISKIETSTAIDHLARIIDASDALMIARGDLGIECPLEDVPHLQKRIIRACIADGVPVITATQMLESMISAPAPTRAEVSDVANAVFDGTDAVMLSGETAIGVDPVRVVETMARIASRAEADVEPGSTIALLASEDSPNSHNLRDPDPVTTAVTRAAWQASRDLDVDAIVCATRSGRTARAMAGLRPACPLLAFSADPRTVRMLAVVWGVQSYPLDPLTPADGLVESVLSQARVAGVVRAGHPVIVLAGAPDRPSRAATDAMRIVTLT